jgi:hypothetical protein
MSFTSAEGLCSREQLLLYVSPLRSFSKRFRDEGEVDRVIQTRAEQAAIGAVRQLGLYPIGFFEQHPEIMRCSVAKADGAG